MKIAILFALALTVLEAQPIEVRSFSQLAPLEGWPYAGNPRRVAGLMAPLDAQTRPW